MKSHVPLTDSGLSNASYCNNDLPFVGLPVNDNDCDNMPDDQCAWRPCESHHNILHHGINNTLYQSIASW